MTYPGGTSRVDSGTTGLSGSCRILARVSTRCRETWTAEPVGIRISRGSRASLSVSIRCRETWTAEHARPAYQLRIVVSIRCRETWTAERELQGILSILMFLFAVGRRGQRNSPRTSRCLRSCSTFLFAVARRGQRNKGTSRSSLTSAYVSIRCRETWTAEPEQPGGRGEAVRMRRRRRCRRAVARCCGSKGHGLGQGVGCDVGGQGLLGGDVHGQVQQL